MTFPRIYLSRPHVSSRERGLLLDAFDSNWIAPLGPHVNAFEAETAAYVGRNYGCALSSGTAAIHLGLKLLGVGAGDEVFVSSLTFSGSVNPICYLGARPVLIDSDWETWNMDPNLLETALKERAAKGRIPKAVIPVDLYGQCCRWDSILEICARYGVPILEDAAEAQGARYGRKNAGQFGRIAILSFNGNKMVTTSGGGMLLTDSEEEAAKVRFWSTQSREPAPHYQHRELGYNYRMSNLCAAVGRGQLAWIDERIARHREIFAFYSSELGELDGITFMREPKEGDWFSTKWLTCVLIDPARFGADREKVRLALEAENIESRPIWKPMHLQPVFAKCDRYISGVSDQIFRDGLCLPSGSDLTDHDLDRIVEVIKQCRTS
ncbi:MAG: DegT/DnrJ/EryC1/StrS family aminotransferase [Thermoguttaceae bacterium]|nr:DegT/DnrJ/EryC1/StrS family aminotransferase [Thermoguttaceae bacterium]